MLPNYRMEAKDNLLLKCSKLKDYIKVINRITPETIYLLDDFEESQEYLVIVIVYDNDISWKGIDKCGIKFKILAAKKKTSFATCGGIWISYEDFHQKVYTLKKVKVQDLPLYIHFEHISTEFERLVK
jgi:hypothetical protein